MKRSVFYLGLGKFNLFSLAVGIFLALIFTRLLKWGVVILLLVIALGYIYWWVKRRFFKTKTNEVVQ